MARPIQIKIKFHLNFAPEQRKPNDICQSLVRTLKRCAHLNTCRIDLKMNYLARGHRDCISGKAGMREQLSLLSRRFWSKFKATEERAGPFSPLKAGARAAWHKEGASTDARCRQGRRLSLQAMLPSPFRPSWSCLDKLRRSMNRPKQGPKMQISRWEHARW